MSSITLSPVHSIALPLMLVFVSIGEVRSSRHIVSIFCVAMWVGGVQISISLLMIRESSFFLCIPCGYVYAPK